MTELNYDEYKSGFLDSLNECTRIVLATCADNIVTTRVVCPILAEDSIMFSTGINSFKCQQMKANSKVAFSLGDFNIEADTQFYGHPSTHPYFPAEYSKKYPHLGEIYESSPDDVLVICKIKKVNVYAFIGKACKDIIDFETKNAYRIEL
ncbi:MAG: hypothetical protein IKL36_01250 [Clostridia bacterium]|nr:hypothetical protein [Clostridia bacterium]